MQTFLGLPLSQEWQDLFIWERFFKIYPVRTFIELGTGHGGLSLFFALQCHAIGASFHTFDNQTLINMDEPLAKLVNLPASFYNIDIFEGQDQIIKLIQSSPHPMAMFFDDGDKPREWSTFAPHLSPGDYCAVHDFGTEFTEEHIGGVPVVRILGEISDKRGAGWKSMWFKRT